MFGNSPCQIEAINRVDQGEVARYTIEAIVRFLFIGIVRLLKQLPSSLKVFKFDFE